MGNRKMHISSKYPALKLDGQDSSGLAGPVHTRTGPDGGSLAGI